MSHYLTVNLKLSSYPPIIAATLLATDTFPEIKTSSKRFFFSLTSVFSGEHISGQSSESVLQIARGLQQTRRAGRRRGG